MTSHEAEPSEQNPVSPNLEVQRALVEGMLRVSPGDLGLLEILMHIDNEIAQRKRDVDIPTDPELINDLMTNDQY